MAQVTTGAEAGLAERAMLEEAERFSALLREVDGGTAVPGMRWRAGEIGAHVVQSAVNAVAVIRGDGSAYDGIGFSAEIDQRLVDALPERDTAVLAEMIRTEYATLAETLRAHAEGEVLGVIDRLTTAAVRAILTVDFLLHGTQIAAATGRPPYPIDAERMRTCVAEILAPLADDRAAAGVTVTYAVTFRGARPLLYGWEDGRLWIDDGREHRVDCRVSADCASFLLQGIGLLPTWKLALTGKAVATGRKPWMVLRLAKLVPPVPHGGVAA